MTHSNLSAQQQSWINQAHDVLDLEMAAIQLQHGMLDQAFAQAIDTILHIDGRLVVIGMGKSGIIAKKIAATFASTGTPAFFVHAAEAQHGDLGMITGHDAVLALSHSGETAEVCGLLPEIRHRGASIIAITGKLDSTLAKHADIALHIPVQKEACPLNLAPTASTTATLALGDALAVVTLNERGFREEDFARVHPAGSLGRKLLRVRDVMHSGDQLPLVSTHATLRDAIMMMSSHRLGVTGIINQDGCLCGCLTDGDLRRILETGHMNIDSPVDELMHTQPATIESDRLASEALHRMETKKIMVLFVCSPLVDNHIVGNHMDSDHQGQPIGIVHMHDILQGGIA